MGTMGALQAQLQAQVNTPGQVPARPTPHRAPHTDFFKPNHPAPLVQQAQAAIEKIVGCAQRGSAAGPPRIRTLRRPCQQTAHQKAPNSAPKKSPPKGAGYEGWSPWSGWPQDTVGPLPAGKPWRARQTGGAAMAITLLQINRCAAAQFHPRWWPRPWCRSPRPWR